MQHNLAIYFINVKTKEKIKMVNKFEKLLFRFSLQSRKNIGLKLVKKIDFDIV